MSFRRLLLTHEVDYVPETSQNLKTWSIVKSDVKESSLNPDSPLIATLCVESIENSGVLVFDCGSRENIPLDLKRDLLGYQSPVALETQFMNN